MKTCWSFSPISFSCRAEPGGVWPVDRLSRAVGRLNSQPWGSWNVRALLCTGFTAIGCQLRVFMSVMLPSDKLTECLCMLHGEDDFNEIFADFPLEAELTDEGSKP